MVEPLNTGAATAAVTGVTFVGLFSGLDAGVLIAAVSGSLIFVLSAREYSIFGRVLLFGASLLAGIVSGPFVSSVITTLTPVGIEATEPLGALVGSAIAVRFLMAIGNNPTSFFGRFRPGGSDDTK